MGKFIGRFVIEPDEEWRMVQLHETYIYESDLLGCKVIIPKGFVTDGASVPRIFWNLIPPFGRYGRAAIVHDYLYRWRRFTRRQADDTLLEAMRACHCYYWQEAAIYLAVRCFGARAWAADAHQPLAMADLRPNLSRPGENDLHGAVK